MARTPLGSRIITLAPGSPAGAGKGPTVAARTRSRPVAITTPAPSRTGMPERAGGGIVMPLRMMQPSGSAVNRLLLRRARGGGPSTVRPDPSGSARR